MNRMGHAAAQRDAEGTRMKPSDSAQPPTSVGDALRVHRDTPLARSVRAAPRARATPLDALDLATRKWLAGERIDIGKLAQELGVSRATLFRWVGTREHLYAEVLTKLYAQQREYLLKTAEGKGLDLLENIIRRNLKLLADSKPLRKFIENDPEFAIRLLTSPTGLSQQQSVDLENELLQRVIPEAGIEPQLDISTLAHMIVRIGEAFLYAPTISGYEPDLDKAVTAIRILVSAEKPKGN
jgi:AcrR family transcriptional regulator